MNIWIIITCCIVVHNYEERKQEYIRGITSILNTFKDPKYKIIIVENNTAIKKGLFGYHKTFLDAFGVPVFYTKSNMNKFKTINYGIMETMDIFECINHFGIQDDDFIVKVTGRYMIDEKCHFFDAVDKLQYSAVVRFGQYDQPVSMQRTEMCSTGLIGLRCKYVKQIEIPQLYDVTTTVEHQWAKVISKLEDNEICFLEKLGIFYKPGWIKESKYIYV